MKPDKCVVCGKFMKWNTTDPYVGWPEKTNVGQGDCHPSCRKQLKVWRDDEGYIRYKKI